MPHKTSEELRNRVIELAREGKTRNAIREETGLSLDTIRSILSEAGVVPLATTGRFKRKTPDDALVEKVLRLHMEGKSMSVISAVTGLSYSQIGKIVRESPDFEAAASAGLVGPREFIHAWQTSNSLDEVSLKLGIPLSTVKARASVYRRRGVPLKDYKKGGRYNWKELSAFAASLLEGENGEG